MARFWKRMIAAIVLVYLFISLAMPLILTLCVFNRKIWTYRNLITNSTRLLKKMFKQVDFIIAFILLFYLFVDVFFPKINFLNFFLGVELRLFKTYLLDPKLPEELKNTGNIIFCFIKLLNKEKLLGSLIRTYWLAGKIGWLLVPLSLFRKSNRWSLGLGVVWALVAVWHLFYFIRLSAYLFFAWWVPLNNSRSPLAPK